MPISRRVPSEAVIRHRGAVRDENGKLAADTPVTLLAFAVAPGGGSERGELSRSGEEIDCTVYLPVGTDITNSDELTVRGKRFQIIVNKWQIGSSVTGGMEVLCVRGQG
jgi:hypothetical protein